MTTNLFMIFDISQKDDVTGEPLFWSNEDGWVGYDTESVLKATAKETETMILPIGSDVRWINSLSAKKLVESYRKND